MLVVVVGVEIAEEPPVLAVLALEIMAAQEMLVLQTPVVGVVVEKMPVALAVPVSSSSKQTNRGTNGYQDLQTLRN